MTQNHWCCGHKKGRNDVKSGRKEEERRRGEKRLALEILNMPHFQRMMT